MSNHPDWKMDCSEFMNGATMSSPGRSVDVNVDPQGIEVRVEEGGSTYERQSTSTYIPMDVIVQMLEHMGFSVKRP